MEINGRVTTSQFYTALLDQNKQQKEMELRLIEKIDALCVSVNNITKQPEICQAYFVHINDEIDKSHSWTETQEGNISDNRKDIGTLQGRLTAVGSAGIIAGAVLAVLAVASYFL